MKVIGEFLKLVWKDVKVPIKIFLTIVCVYLGNVLLAVSILRNTANNSISDYYKGGFALTLLEVLVLLLLYCLFYEVWINVIVYNWRSAKMIVKNEKKNKQGDIK